MRASNTSQAVNRLKKNSDSVWFEPLLPSREPELRLFCLPYAGGSAESYRGWQEWFPERVEICLVRLPGRGARAREQPYTRMLPLVHVLADNIQNQVTAPYALFGHSMGALIGFELTRELVRRKYPSPAHLLVSGSRAPQWPTREPATFDLPTQQFIAKLKALNGTPQDVLDHPELVEFYTAVLRADFEMVDTYEYCAEGRLTCPITVYSGLQDEDTSFESCQAWQEQTTGTCRVRMLSGDHFFIRDPESNFKARFRNDVISAIPAHRQHENQAMRAH